MRRVVSGATGLIGKRLVDLWLEQGHEVTVITRSLKHVEDVFGAGKVKAVTWDKLTREELVGADIVLNLTGENLGNKSWTNAQKKEIINSRVGSTKRLATYLAELGPSAPALFNASAIGIYGLQTQMKDRLPPRFDEDTAIDFNNPSDFLSLVGTKWEKAADPAIEAGVRVVFLRFGIVLAKEGGVLPRLMKPFEYYLGGPIGSGNQPFSWVAIDDVVRAVEFLIAKPDASGAYNIVAPGATKEGMVAEVIGRIMNRPDIVRLPKFLLNLVVGQEMAHELLLEGQNVYPKRLTEAGFKFSYPDVESALNRVLLEKSKRMNFFIK